MSKEEEERKGQGRKKDLYCGGRERLELLPRPAPGPAKRKKKTKKSKRPGKL